MLLDFKDLEKRVKEQGSIATLDNGAIIISEKSENTGLSAGQIKINAGAAVETEEDLGTMHFLEHMSFDETKNFGKRDNRMRIAGSIGLQTNAFTMPTGVVYPIQGDNPKGVLLKPNLLLACNIVSDLVFHPELTEEGLLRERKVIQQERKEGEAKEAQNRLHPVTEMMYNRLYANNPLLRRKPIGTKGTIDAVTIEKLRRYHNAHFIGKNTEVILCGDIDETTIEAVKEMIGSVSSGEKSTRLDIKAEKAYTKRDVVSVESGIPGKTNVYVNFHVPPEHAREHQYVRALANFLAGDLNSIMMEDLREKRGLVYGVYQDLSGHEKTGILTFSYSVDPKRLEESFAAFDECIAKARQGNFDPAKIDAYKAKTLPGVLSVLQTPGWIYQELSSRLDKERFGNETTTLDRAQIALDMEVHNVIEVAQKYLGENRLTFIVK